MSATLERALRLRALGLCVLPVPRPDARHDGKTPATLDMCRDVGCHSVIAWRRYQTRLPTRNEITRWFGGAPMNLAVITGVVSGFVVVDADAPEALHWLVRRLPYTPWQTQTSKGFHLWYRDPGVRVPNRARIQTNEGKLKIDVRGDGGYVIAPGSVHASGVEYSEAGDWSAPRQRVPVFWPGWIQRPQPRPSQVMSSNSHGRLTGDVITRARAYLSAIPRPEIGHGSDAATLYAACRLVRGFGLARSDAEALLWEWAGGRPGWTREWVARKVMHAERYGSEPIGALR